MKRAAKCLTLLWFFYRFDAPSGTVMIDGGHPEQATCEAVAATHGYLTILLSSTPVYDPKGKRLGQYQRACFDGPESMRASITVNVR